MWGNGRGALSALEAQGTRRPRSIGSRSVQTGADDIDRPPARGYTLRRSLLADRDTGDTLNMTILFPLLLLLTACGDAPTAPEWEPESRPFSAVTPIDAGDFFAVRFPISNDEFERGRNFVLSGTFEEVFFLRNKGNDRPLFYSPLSGGYLLRPL